MGRLDEKVVIITGATSGMGRASAVRFAQEGAKVVASGRRLDLGTALVEEIKAAGGEAIFVQTDVTKEADLDNLLDCTIKTYGKLDVLFNNAGMGYVAPLEQTDISVFDKLISLNLRGPFLLIQKAMPYLIESKGNILNNSSNTAVRPKPLCYAYAASKAGLIMLTKNLARDYAEYKVRANVLCPGVVKTDLLSAVPEELLAQFEHDIPLHRLGTSEELAEAALFIVSDEAGFITGQEIVVDGGHTL